VRPGIVARSRLLDLLGTHITAPVVLVIAPPGYGKTSLLAQWAERDARPTSWLTLDDDEDPAVFLTSLALSLDTAIAVDPDVFDGLARPHLSARSIVLERLAASVAAASEPFLSVIDEGQLLQSHENCRILETVVEHLPAGSQVAIAGRTPPPLRIARWRAEGKVLDIGVPDLRVDLAEAGALLAAAGADLTGDEVAELLVRTEGWAVGLYFAALARNAERSSPAERTFGGGDRLLADYIRYEAFEALTEDERSFLVRSSVLDELTGPLCDVALDTSGSARMLEALDASNLLVVPLDRQRAWFRYHHLYRELLRDELERQEPDAVPTIALRASTWCEENGFIDGAVHYAQIANAPGRVGEILQRHGLPQYAMGRIEALREWFAWLAERPDVDGGVAVLGAWFNLESGKAAEAASWAKVAQAAPEDTVLPDGSPLAAWLFALRAVMDADAKAMIEDANQALALLAPRSQILPSAAVMRGVASMLLGNLEEADRQLADAAELGVENKGPGAAASALALRAMIALRLDRPHEAGSLADQAMHVVREAHLDDYPTAAMVHAVMAHVAAHRGDLDAVPHATRAAEALLPLLTHALAPRSLLVRLELAAASLALGDAMTASLRVREAREILASTTNFDSIEAEIERLSATIRTARATLSDGVHLTPAELRLIPMLATHLSFREIADELYVSVHTIKAEVTSIYRKLGVTSRTQAVTRARAIGLLPSGR
jgi:LuxR family maltose regulon positive regulatory protein